MHAPARLYRFIFSHQVHSEQVLEVKGLGQRVDYCVSCTIRVPSPTPTYVITPASNVSTLYGDDLDFYDTDKKAYLGAGSNGVVYRGSHVLDLLALEPAKMKEERAIKVFTQKREGGIDAIAAWTHEMKQLENAKRNLYGTPGAACMINFYSKVRSAHCVQCIHAPTLVEPRRLPLLFRSTGVIPLETNHTRPTCCPSSCAKLR